MTLMTSKQIRQAENARSQVGVQFTHAGAGNVMCLESALDLPQKPEQHVIPVDGDDNYYGHREHRAGIDWPTAGVPHSHLLQRWKLHQPCNLPLSLL